MGGDSFAYSGVEKARRFGYLSQNSDDYLFHNTVAEEVGFTLRNLGIDDGRAVAEAMSLWGIAELAGRNPRELAAGERQRVALAAVTAPSPRVLLLDEPTRGLDPLLKERLGDRLSRYAREKRASVIVVTQDMEFAAARADRVALLFNGELVASGPPHEMFRGEPFYSSQVSRLFRGFAEGVVTLDEAREALGMRGET
jgi:energy-coupling factor transport system ATP-binding protein